MLSISILKTRWTSPDEMTGGRLAAVELRRRRRALHGGQFSLERQSFLPIPPLCHLLQAASSPAVWAQRGCPIWWTIPRKPFTVPHCDRVANCPGSTLYRFCLPANLPCRHSQGSLPLPPRFHAMFLESCLLEQNLQLWLLQFGGIEPPPARVWEEKVVGSDPRES